MLIRKGFRFRIYPTKEQEIAIYTGRTTESFRVQYDEEVKDKETTLTYEQWLKKLYHLAALPHSQELFLKRKAERKTRIGK